MVRTTSFSQRFDQFCSKLRLAHQHLESRKKQGISIENATNATGIELVQCAEAHCRAFLVRSAHEMTSDINKTWSKELCAVLHNLIELYAYDTCMKSIGDLLRVSTAICGAINSYEINSIIFTWINSSPRSPIEMCKSCKRNWNRV